jgi:hypothetical protein
VSAVVARSRLSMPLTRAGSQTAWERCRRPIRAGRTKLALGSSVGGTSNEGWLSIIVKSVKDIEERADGTHVGASASLAALQRLALQVPI